MIIGSYNIWIFDICLVIKKIKSSFLQSSLKQVYFVGFFRIQRIILSPESKTFRFPQKEQIPSKKSSFSLKVILGLVHSEQRTYFIRKVLKNSVNFCSVQTPFILVIVTPSCSSLKIVHAPNEKPKNFSGSISQLDFLCIFKKFCYI